MAKDVVDAFTDVNRSRLLRLLMKCSLHNMKRMQSVVKYYTYTSNENFLQNLVFLVNIKSQSALIREQPGISQCSLILAVSAEQPLCPPLETAAILIS